jgi:hypothetical protein
MNGNRAIEKARTLARKQARRNKRDGLVPATQQRPALPKAKAQATKAPKGWQFVDTSVGD